MPEGTPYRRMLWLARLVLVVLPPLLLFGFAEAVCWILDVPPLADSETFQQYEFMRDCRSKHQLIVDRCSADLFEEDDAVTSVYVFGGSSVQGYPPGKTVPFAQHMQDMLNQHDPGQYAVHNLGVACRDSIYIRKCAERAQGDASDVYVIYAGHNDFANFMVANPRMRILSVEYPRLFAFESTLAKSRFYSFVSTLTQGQPKPWARLPNPQWGIAREIALAEYTSNITRVIEQAEELGIEVLLVTVVSNVTEYPKWVSVTDPTRKYPEQMGPWYEYFREGIQHFEAGRYHESLRAFKLARDNNMGGRAPSELNERVRELAASYPHVQLVDFERTLDRIGLQEGLGCNFFGAEDWCDQFHPNPRTQRLIARETVRKLIETRSSGH